jgi:hypothetical protein
MYIGSKRYELEVIGVKCIFNFKSLSVHTSFQESCDTNKSYVCIVKKMFEYSLVIFTTSIEYNALPLYSNAHILYKQMDTASHNPVKYIYFIWSVKPKMFVWVPPFPHTRA